MPTFTKLATSSVTRSKARNSDHNWYCKRCFKLLGKRSEGRIHVQFARGHQYVVSTPVTAVLS